MGASPIYYAPPPPRKKWHGPRVERKDCPQRKNTTIGETPPLPHGFFYSCSTPWRAPTSPLACDDHDLHIKQSLSVALTLFRLFERVRKNNQQKLNKKFLALSFNFLGGGGVSIVLNTQNFIYR